MKKTLKTLLLFLLLLSTLIAAVSCKEDDGLVTYDTAGIKFKLPKEMREANVSYADLAYADNNGCEFFIYFYSATELLTMLYIDKDSTVLEYADWFVNVANKDRYTDIEREYDEAGAKLIQHYLYEPNGENIYFYDFIIRNESNLYHITMSCDGGAREKYKPIFDEWATYIELSELK